MLEKRTMGYVDFAYLCYDAKAVTAVYDTESGKVELYRPDEDSNEWYSPNEREHFFGTVEEAAKALDEQKHKMIAKMKEVKDYIDAMGEWEPDKDENSPFHFDRQDYLPYHIWRNTYGDDNWTERERQRLAKENKYLKDIIATGFINIHGDTFRTEDVQRICWGKEKAELVLKDGKKVTTCSETERNIVKLIYGSNTSECTYTRLDDDED